jgi:HlyD family secretion protein
MKFKPTLVLIILSLSCAITLTACGLFSASSAEDQIIASGVIEVEQISIASQISGKVMEVLVDEGDSVTEGELLFILEDDLLQKQYDQLQAGHDAALANQKGARAVVAAAQAALQSAESILEGAKINYEIVLDASQAAGSENRVDDWSRTSGTQIDLPSWYFQQDELIVGAENEVKRAWDSYQHELDNFQQAVLDLGDEEYTAVEKRLLEAQAGFEIARLLKNRPTGFAEAKYLDDYIKLLYDQAESELEAAQKAFDQVLADSDYKEILESRARVSVAQEWYDLARENLSSLLQGEEALEVQAAAIQVSQAESGLLLAKAQLTIAEADLQSAGLAVQQAETALDLVNLQIQRLTLSSPLSGVVLTSSIKQGEILGAGLTALSIGNLEDLTVTVYLPENRYGQVALGGIAELRIDSYPDEVFEAVVTRISDQAEYTPRNVQTQEERQNTVYAVKLSVKNVGGKLKPGMPADVTFLP